MVFPRLKLEKAQAIVDIACGSKVSSFVSRQSPIFLGSQNRSKPMKMMEIGRFSRLFKAF